MGLHDDARDVTGADRGRVAARLGAGSFALLGTGFGIGAAWAVAHLERTGELPMTPFGFRALDGLFLQLGTRWASFLGAALAGVCALLVLAAVWLWRGERRGLRLGAAMTAPGLVLGTGFALPFLLIGLPVGLVLALAGRRSLR